MSKTEQRATPHMRRFLARSDSPENVATELAWINSRTNILGESFGRASQKIQDQINEGYMIVVKEEPIE